MYDFRLNNAQALENDGNEDDDTNKDGNKKKEENIKRLSSPKNGNAIWELLSRAVYTKIE